MSRSINKVILVGNVGSDPEIRTTAGGNKVAKLSLATSRRYTDRSGGVREDTQWHRLTVWGKLADVVEHYVHKGDRLYVEGRIEYGQTEDGGQTRHWTDIVVTELVMLGGQSERRSAPARSSAPAASPFEDDDSDDLPF